MKTEVGAGDAARRLILALPHQLARELVVKRQPGCEVRADVRVSLNGRASAPLVDPRIDLAREPAGWRPARWILPAPD